MNILLKKVKNRRRNEIIRIVLTAFFLGLLVVALCVGGAWWYRSFKKRGEEMHKKTVKETAKYVEENVSASPAEEDENYNYLSGFKNDFLNEFSEKYSDVKFSFYVKDLNSGVAVGYNSEKMNSASVIKLFIMETVYKQVAAGNIELTEEDEEKLRLMITESDNESSNYFIDKFGGVDETRKVTEDNLITQTIRESGYTNTELNRKMYDTTPPEGPTGYENYTSCEDVAKLLEGIYDGTCFEGEYNQLALELLKNQKRTNKIPAKINSEYPDVTVANKTGELYSVENDAALILGEDYGLIFVVLVNDIPLNDDGSVDFEKKESICNTISDYALRLTKEYESNKTK